MLFGNFFAPLRENENLFYYCYIAFIVLIMLF